MTLPFEPPYPIAQLKSLLSERVGLDLSSVELAEILWLALQKSGGVVEKPPEQQVSEVSLEGDTQDSESAFIPEQSSSEQSLLEQSSSEQSSSEQSPASAVVAVEPPQPPNELQEEGTDQPTSTALPINIPEAVALRNRRQIALSLRPLMRKVPSKLRQTIDEEATAIASAEAQNWRPVVQPEPERWLELAIVVEVTNLLDVWQDTISEFQHLMERHGAFRDVRTWQLKPNADGEPQLFLQTAVGLQSNARSPRELLDASGRRLVLLLSDCTSRAWRSGKMLQLLQLWSRENPVTIGQLLPDRYWDRSALGAGYPVALRSRLPGARSRDWLIEGLSSRRQQRLPKGLKLPVVTIQPDPLADWARAIAAVGEQQTIGVVLSPQAFPSQTVVSAIAAPLTAKQLVRQFRATASPAAQELADRMAVLPVNWSVIRLIQKNWGQQTGETWQDTGALSLAEIFLSGLLHPLSVESEPSGKQPTNQAYDFVDGVRDVLLGTIPISEAREVGEEIAEAIFKQLPLEVQQRVATDIERRFGESLSYFEAFLIPNLTWGETATAEILPFARVTGQVLRRWGGDYAALAEKLETLEPSSSKRLPPLQTFEFEVATISIETERTTIPSSQLQPFDFEVVVIDTKQWDVMAAQSASNLQEVLARTEKAVQERTGQSLGDVQRLVLEGTWYRKTYAEIASDGNYTEGYIAQDVAPKLWELLARVFSEQVSQTNFLAVFTRWIIRTNKSSVPVPIRTFPQQSLQFVEDLENDVPIELVQIPSGSFIMGALQGEEQSLSNERPQHEVQIPTFFMGKYAVTQAQWRVVAALPRVSRELNPAASEFKGDNRPVERVSWHEAVEFCQRLSRHTGRPYRLPSEAEWEYACRAGTSSPFHFGETLTSALANYRSDYTYGYGPASEPCSQTTDVGSFPANVFGLYDMHGNVWNWCEDDWHDSYEGAPTDGNAWVTEIRDEIGLRLLRGGAWNYFPRNCRSARRYKLRPGNHLPSIGFRIVCSV